MIEAAALVRSNSPSRSPEGGRCSTKGETKAMAAMAAMAAMVAASAVPLGSTQYVCYVREQSALAFIEKVSQFSEGNSASHWSRRRLRNDAK